MPIYRIEWQISLFFLFQRIYIIHKLCENYNGVLKKPQFKNFERFITGIIINDRANVQALAQGFRRNGGYDSLHHFLSTSFWDYEKVLETSISAIKHLDEAHSF